MSYIEKPASEFRTIIAATFPEYRRKKVTIQAAEKVGRATINLATFVLATAFLSGVLWSHFGYGSPYWPRHEADGHYECMHATERHDLCFWLGDKRDDGAYTVKRSRQ